MTPEDAFMRPSDDAGGVSRQAGVRLDIVEKVAASGSEGRPFLQVMFICANAYQRVYRSADQKQYLARCPKCGKNMKFQVGSGGTDQRVFQVSCR